MDKIASPAELQDSLRKILAYAESENPSREKIASELDALADKVASPGDRDTIFIGRMIDVMERQLREMKHSSQLYLRDPNRYAPQLDNFKAAVQAVMAMGRTFERQVLASEQEKTAGSDDVFYMILPQREVMKMYGRLEKEDDQSADLYQQVVRKLVSVLKLDSGEMEAMRRVLDITTRGQNWDIGLLRNNVFKAANAMGIRLPSGMF